jgi:N-acetylmuramic acid 6-phosphate etherase
VSEYLPPTEERREDSRGLDRLSSEQLVALLARDQRLAVEVVEDHAPEIARIADEIARRIAAGGRLHYVGAGTSGRLAVLDAAEVPPTFGVASDVVCAHLAGGDAALRCAVEGAEDDADAGKAQIRRHVSALDAVIGVSASGGAPYVVAAVTAAREVGALTVALVNVAGSPLACAAHECITLDTGAELLTGSTRLKAGTAQKIAMNALSTTIMVRLGTVYDNVMIGLVATNAKLRERAVRIVMAVGHVDADRANSALDAADGSVKVAVVMLARDVGAPSARELLARGRGLVRNLL